MTTYRFKFDDETIEKMDYFAKLHKHDDRKTFKEAWERWVDENSEMIAVEKKRHLKNGYNGDVETKMYKSIRYYYRKKTASVEEKKEKERRQYVSLSRDMLRVMDDFVESNLTTKPSESFNDFCKKYQQDLMNEVVRLKEYLNAEDITEKIKKTYKNRYFRKVNVE